MKIGILGCGHWGANYVRVFQELPVDLVGVADRDASRLRELDLRYPTLAKSPDPWSMVHDPALEALVIATPASTHYQLAAAALEQGKHVLVEKPITLCVEAAERLVELAQQRGRILMVGHTFIYNDAVRRLREIVQAPESGSVYYITAQRNHLGMIREDVSALWDLAPHDISIIGYLLGESAQWVSAVEGRFLRPDVGDMAFVTLGFPGGVLARIEVGWVDAHKVREVVVVTSHRRIVFDDLNLMETLRVYEKGVTIERDVSSFGEFQYLLRDGDIVSPRIEKHEPLRNLCSHFVDCVETGRQPLTDGEAGLRVVRTLEAAGRSIRKGGAPVEIR